MSLCDLTMPYVRSIAGDGMLECLSVTSGLEAENARFVQVLERAL